MKKYIFKAVIILMALTGAFISATAVCSADDGFVPAVRVVYEGTVKAEFSAGRERDIFCPQPYGQQPYI